MSRILKKVEMGKFITTALKSILNLVKLQSLVAKCCKMRIANFVHFCITYGKLIPFSRCRYQFSVRNTKIYKIRNVHSLTFSIFSNVSQPNFAILLILGCSSMLW